MIVAGAVVGDFEPSLMNAVAAGDDVEIAEALADGIRVGLLETTGGVVAFRHARSSARRSSTRPSRT